MNSITVRTYGKLNLYLDITGKREDGYHLLKSVMQSVSLYDTLTFDVSQGSGIELVCDTVGFPKDNSNLIWKAIERFTGRLGRPLDKHITVTVDKQIPSMAGMAGGSADCAAALLAMNKLFGEPLSQNELIALGATLGADVPFTLVGGTVLCEGIGEKLTALPSLPDCFIAAARPDISISTPAAYKAYDSITEPEKKPYEPFEAALYAGDIKGIAVGMFNALEYAVNEPVINEVREKMLEQGAVGAMMTGSGSVVFGLFESQKAAESCIKNIGEYPFAAVLKPQDKGLEITGVR